MILDGVIALKNGHYSNPSDLIKTVNIEKKSPAYLTEPLVLQIRAAILKDHSQPNGYRDVQTGKLMKVLKFY